MMSEQPRTVSTALPDLGQYYGTTTYMRHTILPTMHKGLLLTDGVQYVAEKAGAHWLMDLILLKCREWLLEGDGFCTVKLIVEEEEAELVATDGGNGELHREAIEFTDFPSPGIEFFMQYMQTDRGVEPVIMLTSEY